MRWSDNKTGFIDVPNVVVDVIFPLLSANAQSVYFRIYRQTVGWGEELDEMTYADFRKMTGLQSKNTIKAAIKELDELDLIYVIEEKYNERSYGINHDTLEYYSDLSVCDFLHGEECG